AQCHLARAGGKFLGKFFRDVKSDWHRPENATRQPHVMTNTFIVCATHKAAERRKSTGDEQLQIAKLPPGQIPRRPFFGMSFQFGNFLWLSDEVKEFTAVGRDEMAGRSGQVR